MPDGAHMVFVTMCYHNAYHFIRVLTHVVEIGNDVVNADHVVIRKHHAGIHDKYLIFIFVNGHVFTHFAQSAKWDDS